MPIPVPTPPFPVPLPPATGPSASSLLGGLGAPLQSSGPRDARGPRAPGSQAQLEAASANPITRKEVGEWQKDMVRQWAVTVLHMSDGEAGVVGRYRGSMLTKLSHDDVAKLRLSGPATTRLLAALARDDWGSWPQPEGPAARQQP